MRNSPFSRRERSQTYTSIKPARLARSQKKLTESSQNPTLKKQLKDLIDSVPNDDQLLLGYIAQFKQKIQNDLLSPKKHYNMLESQRIGKKNYEKESIRQGYNNRYSETKHQTKPIFQSVSIAPFKKERSNKLLNLDQARRQFKQNKQLLVQRRLPTQIQNFTRKSTQKDQPKSYFRRYRSDVKMRSNTEEVIRSNKYPSRIYRYFTNKKQETNHSEKQLTTQQSSCKKIQKLRSSFDNNIKDQPFQYNLHKNNHIVQNNTEKSQEVIDNNEKIQDLSTIMAQKQTLNFLGQSCVILKNELDPDLKKKLQQSGIDIDKVKDSHHVSKLLDFVGLKTNELKAAFGTMKQKKRKINIEKIRNVFPKGFFL